MNVKQPEYMPDDIYEALCNMLQSAWYKWDKACDMKRPKYAFWKIPRFKHYVKVTKMAIRRTLSYDFYPETYIPNVRVKKIDDVWSLDVQIWGHPDIQRV
jgi:hypothetical protein